MTSRSPIRRLLALLLMGGVVASSSGFAIHDPDCPHHQAPVAGHHAGAGGAAEGHGHHDGAPERAPAPRECECVGFCALAGMADPALPGLAPVVGMGPTATGVATRVGATAVVHAPRAARQPPATGPPAVA